MDLTSITTRVPIGKTTLCCSTSADEFLVLSQNNIGVYLDLQGAPKQKNTVGMPAQKNILRIVPFGAYLVIFIENCIQVFSAQD